MRIVGSLPNEWTAHELVFTTRTGRPVEPRNLAGHSIASVPAPGFGPSGSTISATQQQRC
jgi:hypothetical protein